MNSVSEPVTPRSKDSEGSSSVSIGNSSESGIKPQKSSSFIEEEMKLDEEEFKQLIWILKDAKRGVPVKDRKKTFKTYKKSFTGKDLVEWIQSNGFALTKEESERLAAELYVKKVFLAANHKMSSQYFRGDANTFYRFSEDESSISIVEIPKSYKTTSYKICVLGGEKVGKTSFCKTYLNVESPESLTNSFSSMAHSDTVSSGSSNGNNASNESYHKRLALKLEEAQETADIELMDTKSISGTEFETSLVKWNEWANGFLLMYSINSRSSFENIPKLYNSLIKIRGFRITPIVVVASHSDLENSQITNEEIQSLNARLRCQHILVSNKSGKGVEKAVELLADSIRRVKDISAPTQAKTGWVKMKTTHKRSYKKRYVVLTHSGLRYYSSEPSSMNDTSTLKGIIPLQNCIAQLSNAFNGNLPRWHSDPNIHKNNGTGSITPNGGSTPSGTKSPISMSSSLSGSFSGSAPNTAPIERRLSEDSTGDSISEGNRSRSLTRNESMVSHNSSMMHTIISNSVYKGQKMRFFVMDKNETEYEIYFSSFEERDDWLDELTNAIERANNSTARKQNTNSSELTLQPSSSVSKALTKEEMVEQSIERFNKSSKKGIAYLMSTGLVGQNDAQLVAQFLWDHPKNLKKSHIGEYWGEPDKFNNDVMNAYLKMIDFKDMDFDEALRIFLSHFTIPGEAQKIDRILTAFANRYASQNPDLFTMDLALLLAFALLMLNTDAHNRTMRAERMRKDQFVGNIRGVDFSAPLSNAYLEKLYDNIVSREIQLEHEREDFTQWDKQGYMIVKESKSRGGTLSKKSGRKLFCILAACCLYIFESPIEKKPIHIVPLGNLQVEALNEGGNSNSKTEGFVLFNPDPKDSIKSAVEGKEVHLKEISFICENRKAMMEWMLIFKLNLVSAPNYK